MQRHRTTSTVVRVCGLASAISLTGGCYTGYDATDSTAASSADDSDGHGSAGGASGGHDDGSDADGGDSPVAGECEPGTVGLRRLNRREYGNTLHDLLGVDATIADALPLDPSKGGFDTNASALGVTAELLDRYIGVATNAVTDHPEQLVECTPQGEEFSDTCVQDTLISFAEQAFRRPLVPEELTDLAAFYTAEIQRGASIMDTIGTVFEGLLVSPQMLYRNYVPETTQSAEIVALDQYALASRISYFLWSSMPDQELFGAAEAGLLDNDSTRHEQVQRMLADPKADTFIETFTNQWLGLSGLPQRGFDPEQFPDVDPSLLELMQAETVALVRHVLTNDLPLHELITADYSFINERLAAHYGIEGVTGNELQRVLMPTDQRSGLLTHASVLAATSHPDRTSIPFRGMWVMESLMCVPPPPPPPDELDTEIEEGPEPTTQRERLEIHRERPECYVCHADMDNLGFGLENYGPTGIWRDLDNGFPIDASGVLPGGTDFQGGPNLAALLAADGTLSRCISRKLLSYGIGRLLNPKDQCTLDELHAQERSAVELIVEIIESDPFRLERTETEEEGA